MSAKTKAPERVGGDVVSDEVIAASVKRANEARGRADRAKRERRTALSKQTHAVDNESVHVGNDTDRQLDAIHDVERDSELPTSWRPQSRLEAPPPRAGYRQRWVRYRADNVEDAEHFDEMLEEGWRPVARTRVKRTHELTADSHGKYGKYYVKRGLILMEIPEQLAIQRARYFQQQTANLTKGIDKSMFKLQNRYMPLMTPQRSTRVGLRARRGSLESSVPGDEPMGD